MARFKVTWEADDGYVGGSRPHTFTIDDDAIDGMSEQELKDYFWEEVEQDFHEKVNYFSSDLENFIAWAKERQAATEAEGTAQ
jgi:hypothetical protein